MISILLVIELFRDIMFKAKLG